MLTCACSISGERMGFSRGVRAATGMPAACCVGKAHHDHGNPRQLMKTHWYMSRVCPLLSLFPLGLEAPSRHAGVHVWDASLLDDLAPVHLPLPLRACKHALAGAVQGLDVLRRQAARATALLDNTCGPGE